MMNAKGAKRWYDSRLNQLINTFDTRNIMNSSSYYKWAKWKHEGYVWFNQPSQDREVPKVVEK